MDSDVITLVSGWVLTPSQLRGQRMSISTNKSVEHASHLSLLILQARNKGGL